MEALLDTGMLLRWAHLLGGFGWLGLAWLLASLDLGAVVLGDEPARRALLLRLAPPAAWLLRWGAALTWLSGAWYGFAHLANQDPEGTLHWLTQVDRGRWIALAFAYGSAMVFLIWFVAWPRLHLALAALSRGEQPEALPRWVSTARRALALVAYLSFPLLYAMAAGRHAGELGHDRPAFVAGALWVTLVGVVLAAVLLHGVLPRVGRALRDVRA